MNRAIVSLYDKAKPYQTVHFVWAILLGLLALTACTPTTGLSDSDQMAIYVAVIRQIYLQDDTFGGNLQPPTLYLVRTTDDSVGDPEAEQSAPTLISEAVQQDVSQALADLPTQIVWVDDADQAPKDAMGAVAGKGAIVTLGNLYAQDDGSVHVSGSIYVAMLAAGGQTYVVEQVDGSWEVTGTTGVLWMS